MAKGIRFYETGGPEVLRWESIDVRTPGVGQVRVRHAAVGLNFADTYFRTGLYPAALPAGMGVEAAGVIEEVGPGVTGFAEGDRVTYTGSPLGAYATERVMDVAPLIKLPDTIPFETAAAMTMRGLTTAYLLRRIADLKAGDTVLLHAAAGGVGLLFTQWAALLGMNVIGTVSTDAKAEIARAHGCTHTIVYPPEDVAARVREITDGVGVPVAFDSIGRTTSRPRWTHSPGVDCSSASARPPAPSRRSTRCSSPSRARCSSPARPSLTTSPTRPSARRWPGSSSTTSAPAASRSRSTSATPSRTPSPRTATSSPAAPSAPPSSPWRP